MTVYQLGLIIVGSLAFVTIWAAFIFMWGWMKGIALGWIGN